MLLAAAFVLFMVYRAIHPIKGKDCFTTLAVQKPGDYFFHNCVSILIRKHQLYLAHVLSFTWFVCICSYDIGLRCVMPFTRMSSCTEGSFLFDFLQGKYGCNLLWAFPIKCWFNKSHRFKCLFVDLCF